MLDFLFSFTKGGHLHVFANSDISGYLIYSFVGSNLQEKIYRRSKIIKTKLLSFFKDFAST